MTAGRDPLRLLSVTEAARVLGVLADRSVAQLPPIKEELMSGREVAKFLGCREQVAHDLIASGEVPSIPFGRHRKVLLSTLVAYLREREGQP